MHIPDGFLDAKTAVAAAAVSAAAVGVAIREVRRKLSPRRVPLLGLTATFVFVAQMLNFPIAGGTSGHLVGAVLAVALVGPAGAVLVLTAVLIVQCFVFADGGVLALGANVLNMAVIGSLVGGAIYAAVRRWIGGVQGQLVAAAFAAWCSIVVAAVACAAELAWAGTVPWRVVFPAMTAVHMVIGIVEAVITALVLAAIVATRPELVWAGPGGGQPQLRGLLVAGGVIVALALAVFVGPLASSAPDGLEKVAHALGFAGKEAADAVAATPLAGYKVAGIGSPAVATALAGAVGTLVMFGVSLLLGRLLARKSPGARPGPAS
jgi:cobalt/nickel transport system permease protein